MLNTGENSLKRSMKEKIILSLITLTVGCGQQITTQQETEINPKKNQSTAIANCAGSKSAEAKHATKLTEVKSIPHLVILDNERNILTSGGKNDLVKMGERALEHWKSLD